MSARKAGAGYRSARGISVLLAENHFVVREGLLRVLERERDIRVIGAVGDGAAAVREAERLAPQVVIMAISMPQLNGIEATRKITGMAPGVGIVVFSVHRSAVMVRRAFDAGAGGYVVKECAAEEPIDAVRAVAAGNRYLSPSLSGLLSDDCRKGKRYGEIVEELTFTETEILRLVADGRSNSEAAAILGLSPRTVETYRARMMRRLGIGNLASLVKYAIRHGMTSVD